MPNNLILIVDDEPSNLATLKQILSADYALAFARNGAEALSAAKKHEPALILLDIQMPDMDGYTVCKKLKADPATEAIPIIFVSSLSEVGDEAAGFECGCVDYIVKPVSPSLVHARVRTHISLVRITRLETYVQQLEVQQKKIARLSRIQAVLSGINSAIVRIRDRQALFNETCRIVVEYGEFPAIWIGLLDQEKSRIKAISHKGMEEEHLQNLLTMTGLDGLLEPGVLNQAVMTGCSAYSNNLMTEKSMGVVCQDALHHGFRSIIALPLVPQKEMIGVMVIYAREAHFFDDEELRLLNELGGDLSFALNHIDQEERVSYLSFYDTLTGLPNNVLFLDRLGQLIQTARRDENEVFVAIVNLDRFRRVNDGLGRHVGDVVLKNIGRRLSNGMPSAYTVARLAGDNFAIAGQGETGQSVAALADSIATLFKQAIMVDVKSITIGAHIGLATFPHDGDDAESLFKNAEAALKQSKGSGEAFAFYSAEFNARFAEKIELENLLRMALERQQFVLYYQPKVDLASGRITGAEALIRWQHPERGLIPPVQFIPLAEESGLIVPIGDWVIRTVCMQQANWREKSVPIVPVALNLSAMQFKKGQVREVVQRELQAYDMQAKFVELELTESLVMGNLEEAEMIMHDFRNLGLSLSLDDFGTGYSSLAYLKRFPFNTVKIDRAFVTDIITNQGDAAIASAIIGMAHSLQMHVIAEGVENHEQLQYLKARGCDQIQGYYFSKPVSAEEFAAMLIAGKRIDFEK